ncbi:MAG: Fur family transcriptional regulator [Candidatus Omnitrophota bacterium]
MRNCGHRGHGEFRGCGYRMTKPRGAILDVLNRTTEHLSAEDVYLSVYKFYPNIGLTTVYRNLELLVEMGVVVKFQFDHGKAKYELADEHSKKGHHHHLVCRKCAKIIDYSDFMEDEMKFLKSVEKGLSKKYDFEIHDHIIQFHGMCSACQGK